MRALYRSILWIGLMLIPLFSQSYVLQNQGNILSPKSIGFIEQLSQELFEKTGVALYVAVADNLQGSGDAKETRKEWKQNLLQSLSSPYGVIFLVKSHKKIDIVLQPQIKGIDVNEIITEYMVPILMQEKGLPNPKVSASILNGYAQLADEIAEHYHQSLQNNLIVDKSGSRNLVRYSIYLMLGIMFTIIALIYVFGRKKK